MKNAACINLSDIPTKQLVLKGITDEETKSLMDLHKVNEL